MSERLETKKAGERTVEHAKELAAPLERDEAEQARNKFHRDPCWSAHQWRGSHFAKRLSRSGNEAQQSINAWLFGDKGRTVAHASLQVALNELPTSSLGSTGS